MNAEALGQTLGSHLGYRRVAQGTQCLCDTLELAPTLACHLLKGTHRVAAYWKRLPGRLGGHCNRSDECNTLAVYAFSLQRICRIFVQIARIVAEVPLTGWSIKPTERPRCARVSA